MKDSTLHRLLMGVWAVLLVPTMLLWKDSLVWIVLMSWYAIFVGHWSSAEAAKAKEAGEC